MRPFAADDWPVIDLQVTGITTVEPQRTYWDKVVIQHGLRAWYDRRGQLRQMLRDGRVMAVPRPVQ